MRPRDIPIVVLVGALSVANIWVLLLDLEVISTERGWAPQWIVFLTVLVLPLVAIRDAAPGSRPSYLWVLVAPLAGAFLVAHYYAFDVYGSPPYARNADAGDMPALAIYLGATIALGTGIMTWLRRRAGIALTVPVCFGCAVLVFFSNVFH
ncbi:MAG TPA: hypothetical protein VFG61_06140 [Gaiellaceae bacterium]|nr:hypothetical protein [Gaiellaceae bacterium]